MMITRRRAWNMFKLITYSKLMYFWRISSSWCWNFNNRLYFTETLVACCVFIIIQFHLYHINMFLGKCLIIFYKMLISWLNNSTKSFYERFVSVSYHNKWWFKVILIIKITFFFLFFIYLILKIKEMTKFWKLKKRANLRFRS